ncbi:MAG TPA: protein translocase subunit SecF [Smithellaceae bacterium]|jgi:preprotein translocase subunit SecF|nr:protein translocase subunit SecF [Smithellaceae bacterium]HOH57181.1 protein translocase subunit SecF [Smithellaceae bacterium]HPB15264.1 protein translocase subunit SecF [Smithellaceae bacterium]HQC10317.1 protein translocase subunit SecF [Smithellaceae bacterium]HQN68083.1 protein translocase subunit SecF [Smithellaceae bacterium]
MEFIKPGTHFDFVGKMKIALGISAALIIISILSVVLRGGLNFGIDFAGGTIIQVKFSKAAPADAIRNAFAGINVGDAIIQEIGENEVIVRTNQPMTKELQVKVAEAMTGQFGAGAYEIRRIEFVGPKVGRDLTNKAILSIVFAWIGMLIYIAWRFEFRYGLGAIIALIHDTIITIGALSLLNKEFTLVIVAALLTIIGYSINDTIVVFDRIRENRKKDLKKSLAEIINPSVNETLSRTILTAFTVILVLLSLFFLGGPVIHDFAFALLVGVVIGTYSSIFIASPIVLAFENIQISKGKRKK